MFHPAFIYGNYIDEVLRMSDSSGNDYYYLHDHLFSPAVLVEDNGTVVERYEYDAYGACRVLEPNFAPDPDGLSDYANCYLFTGRRLDILAANSLKIRHERNRYYDPETGRWLTHDPLKYVDGMNLYEYLGSSPVVGRDPFGEEKEFSEIHREALDALRSLYYKNRSYRFYPEVGLHSLLVTLWRILYLFDPDKVKTGGTYPYWRPLTGTLRMDSSYLLPETIFHELIHIYLNKEDRRLVADCRGEDPYGRWYPPDGKVKLCNWGRTDEGVAHAAQHMLGPLAALRKLEDEVKNEPCPRKRKLQLAWDAVWMALAFLGNSERPPTKGAYNIYGDILVYFDLLESDVENVENYLGFNFSCSSLADMYNDMLKKRNFYCYLSCSSVSQDDKAILIKEGYAPIFSVFK